LRKSLTLLLVSFGLGLGFGQKPPPPDCKPITYFGVSGCELSAQGECPKGYHKQAACPANPMIKAPCRMICVKDAAPKTNGNPDSEKGTGKQRPTSQLHSLGLRPKSVTAVRAITWEGGKGDAIIAAKALFFAELREASGEIPGSLAVGFSPLSGEHFL
jgi:hypothetical protein